MACRLCVSVGFVVQMEMIDYSDEINHAKTGKPYPISAAPRPQADRGDPEELGEVLCNSRTVSRTHHVVKVGLPNTDKNCYR